MSTKRASFVITLSPEEENWLKKFSHEEHIPEPVFLRKLVLDGLARFRLERACEAYARGEADITSAARYAGIGVAQMMQELERRGINHSPAFEDFLDGLELLLDMFGDDEEVRAAIVNFKGKSTQQQVRQ